MGNTVVDPDLQIRGGGGGGGWGGEKEGPVSKKAFSALWASVWSKNKGVGGRPPGPLPWICHWNMQSFELISSKTVDWQLSCLVMGEHLKKMAIH